MDLTPIIVPFLLVAAAELGDKTQLAVITLSSCMSTLSLFIGAMLAFTIITGLGLVIGNIISTYMPILPIRIFSTMLFFIFGIYTILTRKNDGKFDSSVGKYGILSSFSMITLMEIGDKTQLTVVTLAAQYFTPLFVYLGVMVAFLLVTGIGVLVGKALMKLVSLKYIRLASGVVFILFGIYFIFGIFLGY
ncbi:MAG: TMEM165/GDT1 family protein [Thermoproteota archaeon]